MNEEDRQLPCAGCFGESLLVKLKTKTDFLFGGLFNTDICIKRLARVLEDVVHQNTLRHIAAYLPHGKFVDIFLTAKDDKVFVNVFLQVCASLVINSRLPRNFLSVSII